MSDDSKIHRCFMDGIDWQHHLECDPKGTLLFPSERNTREGKPCISKGGGCGIVEVEVRFVRWVEEQDLIYERPDAVTAQSNDTRQK